MKNAIRKIAAIACSTAVFGIAPVAKADGVIGGLINQVAPGVGTALDRANHDLGHPFENAVAQGADAVLPGSGAVLQAGWAIQRGLNVPGAAPQAGGQGPMPPMPAPMPLPQPPMVNRCATPIGLFGPGLFAPLGSPCHVYGPYGVVMGTMVM